ncbi:MAG: hypothetical protein LUG64_00045 [Clostridiales bacterium]|nr:hypothetical protein [Clostridiales bacterium]
MKLWGIGKWCVTALLVVSLCGCGQTAGDGSVSTAETSAAASVEEVEEVVVEPDYIVYPAFFDKTFTADSHMLTMSNSKSNEVDFQFVIADYDGSVLFSSDPVAPGEKVQWDVTERWHGRSHTIYITCTPILADGTEGNPSTQEILITIDL